MGLRVEEDLDVTNALLAGSGQVSGRELVEVPFLDEHRACPVIDVQERLQVAEPIGAPDRVRIGVREPDAVAPRELEHQLGLERPLDMQVQLGLRQRERIDRQANPVGGDQLRAQMLANERDHLVPNAASVAS